jgi:hypothetical protein
MRLIIPFLIGVAIIGPIIILYSLGAKYKRHRKAKKIKDHAIRKEREAIKQTTEYKIKF